LTFKPEYLIILEHSFLCQSVFQLGLQKKLSGVFSENTQFYMGSVYNRNGLINQLPMSLVYFLKQF